MTKLLEAFVLLLCACGTLSSSAINFKRLQERMDIMETRLSNIEIRQNMESKHRREDMAILLQKLEDISRTVNETEDKVEKFARVSNDSDKKVERLQKHEDGGDISSQTSESRKIDGRARDVRREISYETNSNTAKIAHMEKKFVYLLQAFEHEKRLNIRVRRQLLDLHSSAVIQIATVMNGTKDVLIAETQNVKTMVSDLTTYVTNLSTIQINEHDFMNNHLIELRANTEGLYSVLRNNTNTETRLEKKIVELNDNCLNFTDNLANINDTTHNIANKISKIATQMNGTTHVLIAETQNVKLMVSDLTTYVTNQSTIQISEHNYINNHLIELRTSTEEMSSVLTNNTNTETRLEKKIVEINDNCLNFTDNLASINDTTHNIANKISKIATEMNGTKGVLRAESQSVKTMVADLTIYVTNQSTIQISEHDYINTHLIDLKTRTEEIPSFIKNYTVTKASLERDIVELKTNCMENTDQLGNIQDTIQFIANNTRKLFNSCKELDHFSSASSGTYTIYTGGKSIDVFCDQTTDGGGWTVFQRRTDGSVDFYRDWDSYENGFGDLNKEFWLGNKYLSLLTSTGTHELRVELEDWNGDQAYARYAQFNVGLSSDEYRLTASGYSGTAGDALNYKGYPHNGMQFSTKDRDNDMWSSDCANKFKGGWWYSNCHRAHLNGQYLSEDVQDWKGINWYPWEGKRSMKSVEMKFR